MLSNASSDKCFNKIKYSFIFFYLPDWAFNLPDWAVNLPDWAVNLPDESV
jgi:hypothetical protein